MKSKDQEAYDNWVAGGRKGPPPTAKWQEDRASGSDGTGPPEFESLPDIMEMAGINVV